MRKGIKILIASTVIIGIIIVGVFVAANIYSKSTTANINLQIADASGIVNGVYEGRYELNPVKAFVRVTVLDEKMTDIVILEHQTGLGGIAEQIVQRVSEEQSLEVDTISGATMSSKAILKAIENALEKGRGIID